MMDATPERLALSVSEAAALLGVSRPTMYAVTRRADFDAVIRIGSRTLIHRGKLEAWLDAQAEHGRVG